MYKVLLCWRYLLTRYLALACIVSVMLGVATLIVVNSVMGGFSAKLKDRLHGLLSDVIVKSVMHDGFADPDDKMRRIRESSVGDKIEAMTPTIDILGLLEADWRGERMQPRAVKIIGIDPKGRAAIGGFAEHLTSTRNQKDPSFELTPEARRWHDAKYPPTPSAPVQPVILRPNEIPPPAPAPELPEVLVGCFPGYSICHYRYKDDKTGEMVEEEMFRPGDELVLHTVSGVGDRLSRVYGKVVVADYFKSEMSEYDSNYFFVPLDWLQKLRTMENRATSIQIKLKHYADAKEVVDVLSKLFPHAAGYHVDTWVDEQGALLAAISIERGLLNVLLFLIVGVAGFGILAIFTMIIVEKTRDIGILKALGASNTGVMSIFLGYGLLLGAVGSALGTGLGLLITENINQIEHFLTWATGMEVFPRTVYYFDRIPTDVQAQTVMLVNVGALAIAVAFSVLPSLRAALLHPVRALRYE